MLTSRGRLLKARRARPARRCPTSANDPNLQGGLPAQRVPLARGRRAGAGADARWPPTGPGLALGTRDGVVKRVNPEVLGRDEWEVIGAQGRRRGRRRRRAGHRRRDALLHHQRRPAAALRRRRRPAAGPLRRRHGRHQARRRRDGRVRSARSTRPTSVVVTASGSSTALPGTEPGAVKVTPFSEYPAKGRATGGVRCHRFLKGEDTLVFAWAGPAPGPGRGGQRCAGRPARGRPAGATAPACPAASRSPPSRRRPVARPTPRRGAGTRPSCGRLTPCSPRPGPPDVSPLAAGGRRSSRLALAACCGDDDEAAGTTKTPEEVLAAAKTTLDETSGVELDPGHRRPARAASRASPRPPATVTNAPGLRGHDQGRASPARPSTCR